MSKITEAAGSAAVARRHWGPNDPRTVERRQRLAEAQIETAIERALAAAPPLSDAAAERLAGLLRASGDAQ